MELISENYDFLTLQIQKQIEQMLYFNNQNRFYRLKMNCIN